VTPQCRPLQLDLAGRLSDHPFVRIPKTPRAHPGWRLAYAPSAGAATSVTVPRTLGLTTYEVACIELAQRRALPLATMGPRLHEECSRLSVLV